MQPTANAPRPRIVVVAVTLLISILSRASPALAQSEYSWVPMDTGTDARLSAVYGSRGGANVTVFAVGDGGTILRYDGNDENLWTRMSVRDEPAFDVPLRGVWGFNSSHVYAVGSRVVLFYDGNAAGEWTRVPDASLPGAASEYSEVWVHPLNRAVYLAGGRASWFGNPRDETPDWKTMQYAGAGSFKDAPIFDSITDLWGTPDGSSIFLADGGIGYWTERDSTAWFYSPSGQRPASVAGVWGTESTNFYIVGGTGNAIARSAWTIVPPVDIDLSSAGFLNAVHGTAENNAFAVGSDREDPADFRTAFTVILHFDGTSWQLEHKMATGLDDVWADSMGGEAYAVGRLGTAVRRTRDGALPIVELIGLEAIQVIQDWQNSVPLVAGKRTFVRAHFAAAGLLAVRAVLRGKRDGVELPESPLVPANPGGRVSVSPASSRFGAGDALLWELPETWLEGTVELDVEPRGTNEFQLKCREDAGPETHDCLLTVRFEDVPDPLIRFLPVAWNVGGDLFLRTTPADLAAIYRRVLEMYPTEDFPFDFGPELVIGTYVPADARLFLTNLRLTLAYPELAKGAVPGPRPILFAAVHRFLSFGSVLRGLAHAHVPTSTGVITFPSPVASAYHFASAGGRSHTEYIPAHEIAHVLGRPHTIHELSPRVGDTFLGSCGEVAPLDAPAFPYWQGLNNLYAPVLGPLRIGPLAQFDERADDLITGWIPFLPGTFLVADPRSEFELMSYCVGAKGLQWISKETYETVKQAISERFDPAVPPVDPIGLLGMAFGGFINLDDGTATLEPPELVDIAPEPLGAGDYSLVVLEAGGAEIASVSFAPLEFALTPAPGVDAQDLPRQAAFWAALPRDDRAASVEVRHGGDVLARIEASPAAPTVEILSPNGGEDVSDDNVTLRWRGDDADGDPLRYTVHYSADGGGSWVPLALGLSGEELVVARHNLVASDAALVRVQASDGFHVARDQSDAVFRVAGSPPWVFLDRPGAGQLFSDRQRIAFAAVAFDRDDGPLRGDTLRWSSNIDGTLGSGERLSVEAASLAEGAHTISVRAVDSGGLETSETVEIIVVREAPADLTDIVVTIADPPLSLPSGAEVAIDGIVSNNGPENATGVVLAAPQPVGGTIVSLSAAGVECAATADGFACDLGELARGGTVSFVARLRARDDEVLALRITATGSGIDPVPANNTSEVTILVETPEVPAGARFRRGDANGDGSFDISDGVAGLTHLFLGGDAVPCLDALDVNDNGRVDISDPISVFGFLFLGGGIPPAPGPIACGPDETEDTLDCASFPGCDG